MSNVIYSAVTGNPPEQATITVSTQTLGNDMSLRDDFAEWCPADTGTIDRVIDIRFQTERYYTSGV